MGCRRWRATTPAEIAFSPVRKWCCHWCHAAGAGTTVLKAGSAKMVLQATGPVKGTKAGKHAHLAKGASPGAGAEVAKKKAMKGKQALHPYHSLGSVGGKTGPHRMAGPYPCEPKREGPFVLALSA